MMRRIFLSTPLRNEIANIERLFAAVEAQNYTIAIWVIVENGSTDGSREDLARRIPPANVEMLVVLNEDTDGGAYALGAKYARLVNRGFEEIRARVNLEDRDLIGILDADSFPDPDYYSKLASAFEANPMLGIASGKSLDMMDGSESLHAKDWVRGSCRLWSGACMLKSGYIIGPSADTLSLARAELDGFHAKVVRDAVFRAREVGAISKQRYYGASAYFRGNTPLYALLRGLKFMANRRFMDGWDYVAGYLNEKRQKKPRLEDVELRSYFEGYVGRKLRRRMG